MRFRPENGEYEETMVSADEVRLQGRVVYMVHSPRRVLPETSLEPGWGLFWS
jgi:hypothetical protein